MDYSFRTTTQWHERNDRQISVTAVDSLQFMATPFYKNAPVQANCDRTYYKELVRREMPAAEVMCLSHYLCRALCPHADPGTATTTLLILPELFTGELR